MLIFSDEAMAALLKMSQEEQGASLLACMEDLRLKAGSYCNLRPGVTWEQASELARTRNTGDPEYDALFDRGYDPDKSETRIYWSAREGAFEWSNFPRPLDGTPQRGIVGGINFHAGSGWSVNT